MHDRIKAAFDAKCARDSTLTHIKRKIENGTAAMEDTSVYARRLGELLRKSIESTTKPDDLPDGKMYFNIAQSILEPLLRGNYDDVNAICAEVQSALDAKKGIGLKPQKADFPAERVRVAIGGAAVKETAEHAIQVLGRTAENITGSFQTDYVKKNAEFRSKAGLSCYIERKDGFRCCNWCAGLAGRYRYPDEVPKDVYRRHDNCTCDVSYVSEKGRQNVHSKQWTNEQAKAQRIEYAAGLPKPMKLTRAEAQAKQSEILAQRRLTYDAKRGIIQEREYEFGVPYGEHSIHADMEYIKSKEYAQIYANITDNEAVNKSLLECAIASIDHRNGTKFEDMYFIHAETGEILASQTEMTYESGISYNDEIKALLARAKEEKIPLVTLHNHPEGYPPSVDDLNKSYENNTLFGLAAGHNGQVYKYTNPGKKTEGEEYIHEIISIRCSGGTDPDRAYKEEFELHGLSYEIVKGR